MRKKTKNKHGGFRLQVLVAVLMLLVGGRLSENSDIAI
jgi:hypothetical protein